MEVRHETEPIIVNHTYQAVKHLYMFVIDVGVAVLRKYGIGGTLRCKVIPGSGFPGSGLLDQVSESIIRFPRVKPVAGPVRPDMESWWLTPFRTEIFCNPKGVCHYSYVRATETPSATETI